MTSSLLKCGDWMGWWVWKLHTQTSVLAQNLRAKMRISIKMVWLAGSQSMFVQHDRTEIKTQRASRQDKPWCLGLKHFSLLSFGKQLFINFCFEFLSSQLFFHHIFPSLARPPRGLTGSSVTVYKHLLLFIYACPVQSILSHFGPAKSKQPWIPSRSLMWVVGNQVLGHLLMLSQVHHERVGSAVV